ncbi:MAG: hypothetical protein LUE26_08200 [Alistipes sp.]|nr:hypothetical protein [Alistipes sp.]
MKKALFSLLLLLFAAQVYPQDLPFSKLLNMSAQELIQQNFTYKFNKNRYVLSKTDVWAELLETTDTKSYSIVLQYGDAGPAWLRVQFTSPRAYHNIMGYVLDNGIEYRETVSERQVKVSFEADGYGVELYRVPVNRYRTYTAGSDNWAYSRTTDISHEQFTYVISTGNPAASKWHARKQKKQQRRQNSGRKARSITEYM